MKIAFVGESPGRVCGAFWFPHGVPVEVPEDLARSLLTSPVFEAVKASKKQEND